MEGWLLDPVQRRTTSGAADDARYRPRSRACHHSRDHSVFTGLHALFIAIVETALWASTHANTAHPWLAIGYFGIWFACFAFAAAQFYQRKRVWSAAKGAAAAIVSQSVTIALTMAILFLTSQFADSSPA
jgi:hypothetical protein